MSKINIDVITEKLLKAHGRKRRVELGSLILLMASGAVLSFFVFFLLDYTTDIPWLVRPLVAAVLLALFSYYLPRRLGKGVRQPLTVAEVAREVELKALERGGGGFRSILVSAAEFAAGKYSSGSVELVGQVVKEAHRDNYDPMSVRLHDKKLVVKTLKMSAVAAAVLVLWLLVGPASFAVFFGRAAGMPIEYQTNTKILNVKFQRYAALRQDLPVTFALAGELPAMGKAKVKYDGESAFTIPVEPVPGSLGSYRCVMKEPQRSLTFSAQFGDAKTSNYRVDIIPPPFVKDGNVTIKPPAYTKEPERVYSLGDFDVPERSRFKFVVTPDREVENCYFEINGKRFDAKKGVGTSFNLDVAQLGKEVVYSVGFIDLHGIENTDKVCYRMGVIADRPPTVTLEKPEQGAYCAPISKVSWNVKAVDDYGMSEIVIVYTLMRKNDKGENVRVDGGEIPTAKLNDEKSASFSGVIEMKDIKAEAGQTLELQALAKDMSGFNEQGKSQVKVLSVVTPEELKRIMEDEASRAFKLMEDVTIDMRRQMNLLDLIINKEGVK